MDQQPPTLGNLGGIEAEPQPPEPWWKRCYAYLFFMLMLAVIGAGAGFYFNVMFMRHRFYDMKHEAEHMGALKQEMIVVGALGFALAAVISLMWEFWLRPDLPTKTPKAKGR
jgi:uncharacterized BrkB/YihY/UPF0761 family membrane protein